MLLTWGIKKKPVVNARRSITYLVVDQSIAKATTSEQSRVVITARKPNSTVDGTPKCIIHDLIVNAMMLFPSVVHLIVPFRMTYFQMYAVNATNTIRNP